MPGSWIMPNGHVCVPEDPNAFENQVAGEAGCRWNGGYCELLGGGEGREYACPESAVSRVVARAPVVEPEPEEQLTLILGEGVRTDRPVRRTTATAAGTTTPAAATNGKELNTGQYSYGDSEGAGVFSAVMQGFQDAVGTVGEYFSKDETPTTSGQPSAPAPGFEPSPGVQSASIMPSGALPWVAGGLIVLAVGAGVWALWPREEV